MQSNALCFGTMASRDLPRDSRDLSRDSRDLPRDQPRLGTYPDSRDQPRDSRDLPRDSGLSTNPGTRTGTYPGTRDQPRDPPRDPAPSRDDRDMPHLGGRHRGHLTRQADGAICQSSGAPYQKGTQYTCDDDDCPADDLTRCFKDCWTPTTLDPARTTTPTARRSKSRHTPARPAIARGRSPRTCRAMRRGPRPHPARRCRVLRPRGAPAHGVVWVLRALWGRVHDPSLRVSRGGPVRLHAPPPPVPRRGARYGTRGRVPGLRRAPAGRPQEELRQPRLRVGAGPVDRLPSGCLVPEGGRPRRHAHPRCDMSPRGHVRGYEAPGRGAVPQAVLRGGRLPVMPHVLQRRPRSGDARGPLPNGRLRRRLPHGGEDVPQGGLLEVPRSFGAAQRRPRHACGVQGPRGS